MNKFLLPVLGAVAVGAGAFGIIQMSAVGDKQALIDQLTGQLTQAQKDRDAALDKAAKALAELKLAEENSARLAKERDNAKARNKELVENAEKNAGIASEPAPGQPVLGKKEMGDLRNLAQGFFKTLDDPKVREAMKAEQTRMISGAYAPLFTKLGLDDQNAKLAAELIADRNMSALEAGRKLTEGAGSDPAALAGVRKQIEGVKSEYDGKIRSVLGEQNFGEFSTYEQTMGDQRSLNSVARNFESKGIPLQPDQRDTLSNIMREERLKSPSNEIPDLGGGPGMSVLMTDAEAQAKQQQEDQYNKNVGDRMRQAGFSPDQVNAYQENAKQRSQSRTLGRAMGQLFIGGRR